MADNFFIYDKKQENFFFIKKIQEKVYKKSLYTPSKLKNVPKSKKEQYLRKLNRNFLFWFFKNKNLIKNINREDYQKINASFQNQIIDNSIFTLLGFFTYFSLKLNLNNMMSMYPRPKYFRPINVFLAFSVFFGFSFANTFQNNFYLNNLAFKYSGFYCEPILEMEGNDDVNKFLMNFRG